MDWTVPVGIDKEKRILSKNRKGLNGFTPDFKRSEAVFQINTLKIVELNILSNGLFNIRPGIKLLSV